jgi:hypothetical protein
MQEPTLCELCGKPIAPNSHYVVRVDVFADPSMPETTSAELEATDFDGQFAELLRQMSHLSEDDLQDQVHRRFEYKICPKCQPGFLANPLGKPRVERAAKN